MPSKDRGGGDTPTPSRGRPHRRLDPRHLAATAAPNARRRDRDASALHVPTRRAGSVASCAACASLQGRSAVLEARINPDRRAWRARVRHGARFEDVNLLTRIRASRGALEETLSPWTIGPSPYTPAPPRRGPSPRRASAAAPAPLAELTPGRPAPARRTDAWADFVARRPPTGTTTASPSTGISTSAA